jgi:hypothetical protein
LAPTSRYEGMTMRDDQQAVAALLREAQEQAGVIRQVVLRAFVDEGWLEPSITTVHSWFRGDTTPSVTAYNVIARCLNRHLKEARQSFRLPVVE